MKKLLLGGVTVALGAFTACGVEPIENDRPVDQIENVDEVDENEVDETITEDMETGAYLRGDIGSVREINTRGDLTIYAYNEPGYEYLTLQTIVNPDNGSAMAYLSFWGDLADIKNVASGIYTLSASGEEVVLAGDDETFVQADEGDEVIALTTYDETSVSGVLCSGPSEGSWDYDVGPDETIVEFEEPIDVRPVEGGATVQMRTVNFELRARVYTPSGMPTNVFNRASGTVQMFIR
jgi:hypothetical protein